MLCFGKKRRHYTRHIGKRSGKVNCTGGGEGDLHIWAKEDLARYLSQGGELKFFSRCKSCEAKTELGSVPVRPSKGETVKIERRLPSGGIADIAVCAGDETKVVIEVFSKHRTAPSDRPEVPWFEVRADDVLTMLKANKSYIECVRGDRGMCPKCESKGERRKAFGQWKLFSGPHKDKTFEEVSSNNRYVNYLLGQLVEGQYQELNEQIVDNYWGHTIAFELPKRERMNVSAVFRYGKLKKETYLAFAKYLITDPDLYAIEAKTSYKLAEDVNPKSMAPWEWARVNRKETVSAKRVGPYTTGTKRASGVTLARFNFHSGKWTTYPRVDDDDGYY